MASTKLPARLLDTSAVPELNVTGNLIVDTTTLKVDASSNRIGIGTASPGSLLTVEGDIRQTTGDFLYGGGGNWDIKHLADDQNILFYTSESGSATEKLRIKANGNVGIGTSSPAYKLDVQSTSDPAQIRLKEDGNTNGFIFKNYNGNEAQLVNADDGPMVFKTNDSERLRIGSAGQIGIGGSNYGTSGQVLTSTGASTAPSWQTAGGGKLLQVVQTVKQIHGVAQQQQVG